VDCIENKVGNSIDKYLNLTPIALELYAFEMQYRYVIK
jgi:hypothetical protein